MMFQEFYKEDHVQVDLAEGLNKQIDSFSLMQEIIIEE